MSIHLKNITSISLLLAGICCVGSLHAQPPATVYQLTKTLHVGGNGRWDYLTLDDAGKLLFVPRATHTQVIETSTGKLIADIPGQTGNHGVALVPSVQRGFISDGKDGSIFVFDLRTYDVIGKIKAHPDADGIVYDEATNKVLVVSGDDGVLMLFSPDIDLKSGAITDEVDLGGSPEYFAIDGKGTAYVNVNSTNEVAVVDLRAKKVIHRWSTAPGGGPAGMAIDRVKGRLYIGCTKPQKMIVMDTRDGSVLADLAIGPSVDATKFDENTHQAFASCRDGTLSVVSETAPGKFEVTQVVKTSFMARTMALDSATHTIYLPKGDFSVADGKKPELKADSFGVMVVAP